MTSLLPFYYDINGFLQNDKSFMITGKHLAFLTAFLNSSLFKFIFSDNFPKLGEKGRELRKVFFDKIPIKVITDAENEKYIKAIDDIQSEYKRSKAIAIDNMIFDLYNLTDVERQIVGFIEIE